MIFFRAFNSSFLAIFLSFCEHFEPFSILANDNYEFSIPSNITYIHLKISLTRKLIFLIYQYN